jgi:transposase InsO family protein
MLVELGLVEQRHKAVLEVLGGTSVTDVARRYEVTRQTVHAWLRRYGTSGLAGLVSHSSRPTSCPHQMRPEVVARVVEMRRAHSGWGPRTIRHHLACEGTVPLPGRSSIYRCLVRHRLIEPQKRRRRREDYRRWERSRSMELWQMDIMGGVRLADGRELQIVTGLDDHSRFCISAMLVARATARPVCEALAAALRRHGVPDQILTDNGKVFTGRFGLGKGEVLFDRICRENGIRHLLTAPRSPTTTGKVERFHKTVRKEFLSGRVFVSPEEAQAELDAWVGWYNTERPHQGIGMVFPADRFTSAPSQGFQPVVFDQNEEDSRGPQEPHPGRLMRKVCEYGRIRLAGLSYQVGRFLAGETVEVEIGTDGLMGIYLRGVLVATVARRHSPQKEAALYRMRPRGMRRSPGTVGPPVMRKVDCRGNLSFAGTNYRAGNPSALKEVEVRVVRDVVQIWLEGKLIRTHPARHDKDKEHGAFGVPGGRPRKKKAS